ncbi:metallophosphoesterase family protein [Bacillus taeanensis]|uniref:Phosphoesterase n=1 Tax=Bacillus taeanensis TaxID=273032 RepID=A0A366Y148_9BACI|nr:YfcE family phosphodiesterase [Bacillus taeanensis]RBW70144.1 YfcE family phosphodiesterase [Bacillus taeanensis]
MKIAFLSDIHGNADALEAVIRDIEAKQVDKIVVLGDICYRGPEPKRALELVKSLNAEVVKGNADEWVVRGVEKDEVPDKVLEMMNKERDWTVSQLEKEDVAFLKNLPLELTVKLTEEINIHAFHATPNSLFEVVLPNEQDNVVEQKMMAAKDASIYIYGHIHRAFVRYINGKCLINMGSVGLPFDGLPKASYAIVEVYEGSVRTSIERVEYDLEKVIEKYKRVNYPNTETMSNVVRYARLP